MTDIFLNDDLAAEDGVSRRIQNRVDGGIVELLEELLLILIDDDRAAHSSVTVATELSADDGISGRVFGAVDADGSKADFGRSAAGRGIAGQQVLLDAHGRHPVGMDHVLRP